MTVSESDLHAYVDGEPAGAQLNSVANEVLSSKALFDYICHLQTLKQLSCQAYESAPISCKASSTGRRADGT